MTNFRKLLAITFTLWVAVAMPTAVLAQDAVDAQGNPTGAPVETGTPAEETGAPEICTGNGCGQGAGQGIDQGADNGGPTLEDLGGTVDEEGNEVLPEGVEDTRQGAQQGGDQGAVQGASQGNGGNLSGENTSTGADSDNTIDASVANTDSTAVTNSATDTSTQDLAGNSGGNTANKSTGASTVDSGDVGIAVTQAKTANTTAIDGTVGLSSNAYDGDYQGDLVLDFENAISLLAGAADLRTIRAINDTTGQNSNNDVILSTIYEEDNVVNNTGDIDNTVDVSAITGQNEASMNTEGGTISTGNANAAINLLNLLNTTVVNGNLQVAYNEIYGNLVGNIVLPDFGQLFAFISGGGSIDIDAQNDNTGSDSDNTIDIDIVDAEKTNIDNDADIKTTLNADTITGRNETIGNTLGGEVDTGDASVSASNVSVANTTVEGGNWGLVIVNALNRWVGYLVNDSGETRALSQDETLREIEARNSNTGADSDNIVDIDDLRLTETNIDNDAKITNTINAKAVSGENKANYNTGGGDIDTGEANILASVVNIANTTVKDANLGIAVVNVFGDWFGDLIHNGASLLASAGGGGTDVTIDAGNANTGSNSTNTVDVDIDKSHETKIDNDADIDTIVNANIDTGSNKANKNTLGANIETGNGVLALHSRSIANTTAVTGPGGLSLEIDGENDTTGFKSKNKVNARINDERILDINNDASVLNDFMAWVNTGSNELNYNTVGGTIDTGNIDGDVAFDDMLNRLMIAYGGSVPVGLSSSEIVGVDADLLNKLTGAESDNDNDVAVARSFLEKILNNATVDNLLDLLLNTGRNQSDGNTSAYKPASVDVEEADVTDDEVVTVAEVSGSEVVIEEDGDTSDEDTPDASSDEDSDDVEKEAVIIAQADGTAGGVGGPGVVAEVSSKTSPSVAASGDESIPVRTSLASVSRVAAAEAIGAFLPGDVAEAAVVEVPGLDLGALGSGAVAEDSGMSRTMMLSILLGLALITGVLGGVLMWLRSRRNEAAAEFAL